MKYQSNQLLDELNDQTELSIDKAIKEWQLLSNADLLTEPELGQWNAVQCLEHLNSYGRYYLPAIEKAIRNASQSPAMFFKSGWLGNYFYKLMLPEKNGTVKKKMKSPKNHQPASTLNAAVVLNEFISQQEQVGQLLLEARLVNLNNIRVPISIAPFIKLKLGDTFLFVIAHTQRHVCQAEKAIISAKKIKTGKSLATKS